MREPFVENCQKIVLIFGDAKWLSVLLFLIIT